MNAQPSQSPRAVLVTGGARRLGAAICEAFARAGWQVWCQYRASGDEAQARAQRLRAEGAHIDAVEADITTAAGRQSLMAQVTASGYAQVMAQMAGELLFAQPAEPHETWLDKPARDAATLDEVMDLLDAIERGGGRLVGVG